MEVIYSKEKLISIKRSILTVGSYDGIHIGHRELLSVLVQNSKGGGLSAQFGGSSSNQFMGVQKTNDLLEKVTWTLAITIVLLTMLSKVFLSDTSNILDNSSPNIDRANEQNVIPSFPNQNNQDTNQEIDSLL